MTDERTRRLRELEARWKDQGELDMALKVHPSRDYFHAVGEQLLSCAKQLRAVLDTEGDLPHPIMVDRDADLRIEMRAYLDTLRITGNNIGNIRRSLFVPWDSLWNGWVRDETAARELRADTEGDQPIGTWPEHCEQRAFVAGAAWWQFHAHGSTVFGSERTEAEGEAIRRYGEPISQAPVAGYSASRQTGSLAVPRQPSVPNGEIRDASYLFPSPQKVADTEGDRPMKASEKLRSALIGILELGRKDTSNEKYDGYYESAEAAIRFADTEGDRPRTWRCLNCAEVWKQTERPAQAYSFQHQHDFYQTADTEGDRHETKTEVVSGQERSPLVPSLPQVDSSQRVVGADTEGDQPRSRHLPALADQWERRSNELGQADHDAARVLMDCACELRTELGAEGDQPTPPARLYEKIAEMERPIREHEAIEAMDARHWYARELRAILAAPEGDTSPAPQRFPSPQKVDEKL